MLVNTINEAQFLREAEFKLETRDESIDYNRLTYYEDNLKKYEEAWKEKGFLRSTDDPETQAYLPRFDAEYLKDVRGRIVRRGESIVAELKRNRTLVEIYKPSFYYQDNRDRSVEDVLRCLDPESTFYRHDSEFFDRLDYDRRFVQAARTFFRQRRDELGEQGKIHMTDEARQARLETARGLDTAEVVSRVRVEGIADVEGKKLLITQDNVTNLLTQLPPQFIDGIEIIAANVAYDKSKSKDPNYETLGCHIPQYDSRGNYISSRIEVYTPIHAAEDADELQVFVVQKEFIDTLTHEIGHKVHHGLTQDEMTGWEDVMEKDETAITWYVKYSREQDENRGKREDFCESFMLYMGNPAVLLMLSQERFQYMNKLVQDYLPPDRLEKFQETLKLRMAIQIMQWKDNNYSVDDIRNMYLLN